jgi:hypothetical protein
MPWLEGIFFTSHFGHHWVARMSLDGFGDRDVR